jgi:hypothetical protein
MTIEYKEGQILTDKKRKPYDVFVVRDVYTRHSSTNPDYKPTRVIGMIIDHTRGITDNERDLDSRSLEKMFPYVLFNIEEPEDEWERK